MQTFRGRLGREPRAEPKPPVLFEIAWPRLARVREPGQIIPRKVGPPMMIQIPLPVEQNPAHQTIVIQIPSPLDYIALRKGVADVLSRRPIHREKGIEDKRVLPAEIEQPKQRGEDADREHDLPADRPNLFVAEVPK